MTDSRALTAVGILLGGASRRMGTPKHAIALGDESTLLDRMVTIANTLSDTIVLCGDGVTSQSCTRVEDRPGSTGPLAGIEALLHHVRQGRCLILPCDMPNLNPADLLRLATAEADLAVFAAPDSEKTRSLPMLIDASMLPAIEQAMTEHNGAIWAFIRSQPHAMIEPPADPQSLVNLNTPDELQVWLTSNGA